jgi:hypothetical protein
MPVLMAFHGCRVGKRSLSQERRMIERKQLKQANKDYRWNEDQNK